MTTARWLLWGIILLLILLPGGCRFAVGAPTPVVLYTSVPSEVIAEIEPAFEATYPDLDLQPYRAGTSDIMSRVEEELAAGRIEADVLWVADFTVGEELKAQNALLQYTPAEADAILASLRDPDGNYFAGRLLNMVVAYNTTALSVPPTDYDDLLDSRYHGRVGHADPTSGAFLYFMGTLLQNPDYDVDFFKRLSANAPRIQNNTETAQSIAAGDLDIGLTIDFIVRNIRQENPEAPIYFIYPENGVVMVPSPIAIFKDAPHREEAKVFERYILSRTGQALLRDKAGVVPVRLDVKPPADVVSITQLQVIPTDPTWIRLNREEIVAIYNTIYGE